MKKFLIFGLIYLQTAYGGESLEKYFSYVSQLGQTNGCHQMGEIELILDPSEISRIEQIQEQRLLLKGYSAMEAAEFSRVGIVNEDQYWIWLRDAVYFPKGVPGTYDRLIWRNHLQASSGRGSVAILPVLLSGHIALNLNFRHATRSWEFELPRGGKEDRETDEEAALRELKEETGYEASSMMFLGNMTFDTGMQSSVTSIFLGKVSAKGVSNQEYSEAIIGIISFSKEELKQGLLKGSLEVMLNGKQENIPLRDPCLTFALLQAEIRGLL
jgi:ADP-ribose pyrophosphatase